MKKVIIINGTGGSGKDTFVDLCDKNSLMSPYTIFNYSIIQYVKGIALSCGWTCGKTEKDRKFLSDLKDLMDNFNNLPRKKVEEYIDEHLYYYKNPVIFIHCRSAEDIDYFKNKYNAITLLITNKHITPITSNHADNEVFDYTYDYYITNDGTIEDLDKSSIVFLDELRKLDMNEHDTADDRD